MEKTGGRKILYLLFFVTGISGLIYQVLWARMFGLVFGNTIFASSTVLAAFMGGLALGSFLAGLYVANRSDGLRIYALMESIVGVFGAFMPLILAGLTGIYIWFYRSFNPSFQSLTVLRFILSFIVLVIPCIFMGGTLPVLSKYIIDRFKVPETIIGRLYGINTLGAVVGCFSTGFILIGRTGLIATSIIAALLNFSVAVTAYLLFTKHQKQAARKTVPAGKPAKAVQKREKMPEKSVPVVPAEPQEPAKSPTLLGWVLLAAYALSGFAALALEVGWTRALVWAMGMDSYAFAAMLSVILTGIGLGSLIFSLYSSKIKNDARLLYIIQFLVGLFVVVSIYAIHHSIGITRGLEDAANNVGALTAIFNFFGAYTVIQMLVSASLIFIPSLLMGIAFPLFASIYVRINGNVGRGIGNIYSANTFGGILGSVSMGFLIIPAIGLLPSIAVMAAIYFTTSLAILLASSAKKQLMLWAKGAGVVALAFLLIFTTDLNITDFLKTTLAAEPIRADEKLLYFKEHSTGGVMVKESKFFGREMLIDGVQVASSGDFDLHSHLYPAHLMSLLAKDPQNALVIAFGCGGTSGSMLKYDDVKQLDVVEICDGVVEPAKKYFSEMNSNVFQNPKLNLIIQDGRNYVRMTDKKYDIIYSGPIHPQSNQGSAALYTKDFFKDCEKRLNKGGFQCLWLPMHMSSPEDFKAIVKSFMEVYPHVTLWQLPQTDTSVSHPHLIGSDEEIYPDYQVISEKLKKPGIIQDLSRLNDTAFKEPYEFISQLAMSEENLKQMVSDTHKLNTDNLPTVEFYDRSRNNQLASKITKTLLLGDMVRYMENPFPYVKNVPADKKDELKKQLDRLFEGNKNLVTGHFFVAAKNYSTQPVDESIKKYYTEAFKYIPESTYLKKYFEENK